MQPDLGSNICEIHTQVFLHFYESRGTQIAHLGWAIGGYGWQGRSWLWWAVGCGGWAAAQIAHLGWATSGPPAPVAHPDSTPPVLCYLGGPLAIFECQICMTSSLCKVKLKFSTAGLST